MSANKTLDGRSFGQKLMSGAFIYTLISIVLGFGVGAVALLAAGCTLHMRLRNRFIDQL